MFLYSLCYLYLDVKKKESEIVSKNNTLIKPYTISYEDRKIKEYSDSLKKSGSTLTVLLREGFYGESNLIVDKKGELYYYQNPYYGIICQYGRTEKDTLPLFQELNPKDLIKISNESIEDLIKNNVMNKKSDRQILVVGSQNDTIKNTSIFKAIKKLRVPTYLIRRTTQEEDTVLHYKKTDQIYFYDAIKWDTTKIEIIDYHKIK